MAEETTITKPAPFLEAAGTILTERLMPFLDPAQAVDTSKFAPSVAAETQLQQQAYQQAAGLGSLVGPQAYQQFMSPYQQEVIKATEADLERQKAKAMRDLSAQAVGSGAFGGAREGIARAEYMAAQDIGAAQTLANLRQQGFESAQQQALAQLQAQQGLGSFQQQMGLQQQAQQQAIRDAAAQAAREAAYEPQQRIGFAGQQLTGLMGGYPAQAGYQTVTAPPPSPLQTALGIATTGAGIFGALGGFGGAPTTFG